MGIIIRSQTNAVISGMEGVTRKGIVSAVREEIRSWTRSNGFFEVDGVLFKYEKVRRTLPTGKVMAMTVVEAV